MNKQSHRIKESAFNSSVLSEPSTGQKQCQRTPRSIGIKVDGGPGERKESKDRKRVTQLDAERRNRSKKRENWCTHIFIGKSGEIEDIPSVKLFTALADATNQHVKQKHANLPVNIRISGGKGRERNSVQVRPNLSNTSQGWDGEMTASFIASELWGDEISRRPQKLNKYHCQGESMYCE